MMRWIEWWHAVGAAPAEYFKVPRGWGRRKAYINGYLEGLHDAARVAYRTAWTPERGHNEDVRTVMKAIHAHHNKMEGKFT